jgi:hypothetical protein
MRRPAWIVLAVLAAYSAVDEALQPYVGRTCDLYDFAANMSGVVGAMVILTLLRVRAALLAVTAISIFAITNLARANIAEQLPFANLVFHTGAYAFLTIVWLANLPGGLKARGLKWCVCAAAGPITVLAVVKASSQMLGRYWRVEDAAIAAGAILAVVVAAGVWEHLRRKACAEQA